MNFKKTIMKNISTNKIVILGGGITGLTLARELSKTCKDKVVLLEKEPFVGGLAATLCEGEISFDIGSHRLHRNTPRKVIQYIEKVIQGKLLKRERHGRLYFGDRSMKYPPDFFDFCKAFSGREITGFVKSYTHSLIEGLQGTSEDFKSLMIRKAGKEIYEIFYKDYTKKLWGKEPRDITIDSVKKRKIFLDLRFFASILFGGAEYFLYPKGGMGELAEGLRREIVKSGAEILPGVSLKGVSTQEGRVSKVRIEDRNGNEREIDTGMLISTIPIDDFYGIVVKEQPGPEEEGSPKLEWRGIRLLFVLLEEAMESPSETYYFTTLDVTVGRVSEIKKYSPYLNPGLKGAFLTIELPSSKGDKIWNMGDQELLAACIKDLVKTGVLRESPKVLKCFSHKFDKVYPIYQHGWKSNFFKLYDKLNEFENLFMIGRGGLFLHCNIDHCIIQALELSKIILKDQWRDKEAWDGKVRRYLKFGARD